MSATMQTRMITTRLPALALAIATAACAPRAARAQDPTPPAKPAPPVLAERPVTQPTEKGYPKELQRSVKERTMQLAAEARVLAEAERVNSDLARAHQDIKFKDFHFNTIFRGPSDQPTVITTEPIDAAAHKELREDLTVMDKLVREEVSRAGADAPSAMGIKLTIVGQSSPMYVEGAGAVFNATVNWPLAPAGATAGKKDDRPRDPESKWEIAKREIASSNLPRRKGGEPAEPIVFDQARLDALRSALLSVLPEATNIRQLKPTESVIITIQGIDEAGYGVRMTLKASKADVDAAAAGKINADDFAQRVAQRIG